MRRLKWLLSTYCAVLVFTGPAAFPQQVHTPREQALDFIRNETQFHLGYLPTEQSHPKTRGLSQTLQADTAKGIRMLLSVDEDIPPLARKMIASPEFAKLRAAIKTALDSNKKVYFSGCGATGRLSILLDAANRRYWRETFGKHPELKVACGDMAARTHAVMTGGDFALIRSVEMFEDYITFGYHQMEEAGVSEGDVIVAISEGGETSSVIGTVLRGVDVKAKVFFLFNNPADLLADKLERCRKVIRNDKVTTLVLCTGPMAVAGSTRMQATTVELLVAGMAFEAGMKEHLKGKLTTAQMATLNLDTLTPEKTLEQFEALLDQLRKDENVAALVRLTDYEKDLYSRGGRITYFADSYILDIFTDTTERSPTFKIPPFRRHNDTASPAPWAFVKDALRPTPEAWLRILEHQPHCLEWTPDTYIKLGASESIRARPPQIDRATLHQYLIGNEPDVSRTEVKPNAAMAVLIGNEVSRLNADAPNSWQTAYMIASGKFDARSALIIGQKKPVGWNDTLIKVTVDIPETPLNLFSHLAVKLVLNNTSSATMGKMGRLNSNWMAHVDASNKKLIDRSTRLVVELAGVDYETACIALFETMEEMKDWDEARRKTTSSAAYTVERLLKKKGDTTSSCQPFLDWKLGLGNMHSNLQFVVPADMKDCQVEKSDSSVKAIWKGHKLGGDSFAVNVNWQRQTDGLWSGRLSYDGYQGDMFVEEIHFPVIKGAFKPDSKFVFAGWDCGVIYQGPKYLKPGIKVVRQYSGAMQFSALINADTPSLYFDHRDVAWNSKACEYSVTKDGSTFSYSGIHYPGHGDKPGVNYRIPYENCFTEFKGDWFEAGQIYKKWGTAQSWNAKRTAGNPLRKIGMWVWNRGLVKDVFPPIERLQKELGDIPVALDWYWWHSNPYDTDYPEFWPPREGVETFRNAVARLKSQGIFSQVYINGVCWDLDGQSWEQGGPESVVVLRNGQQKNTAFNRYNHHRLGYMCGEAPKFQNKISSLVKNLRESGLDGQYLDMIGCATYDRCYNPVHRHLKGDSAGPAGYRALLQRLKKENPNYPLSTETCNEAYMDILDGAIVCNSTSMEHLGGGADPIPLFQSVYHGDFAFFGNYAHPDGITPWDPLWPPEDRWKTEKPWHKLYPDQFFVELGRTVAWGVQPMVCHIKENIFTDPEFSEIHSFIINAARFYHSNREYLFDGEMLSPAGFDCETVNVDFMARMIFTKENQCKVIQKQTPAILHSCWKAPDGKKALIMVNITGNEQKWTFKDMTGTLPAHSFEKRVCE
ncbi:MAG: hypothetical protein A2283_21530 [Lentisphaerae bacterium RIFOXYA12_FULL_48_11]|nr:MAG: hypothetical protein A2283_21530 [Lentisphaerae bacterium RIFOXYA12_FULL_48_11]